MTRKELLQKVQELERRVRDLEARPVYVPVIQPAPIQPYPPPVFQPWWERQPIIYSDTWT